MTINKNQNSLLKIPIEAYSKEYILEKIIKNIKNPSRFFHVVSLNPEILVETSKNAEFLEVVTSAQIRIIDGSGVILASRLKGISVGERYTGVELMEDILKGVLKGGSRVMLLGGKPNVADKIINCQKRARSKAIFSATVGIKDIQHPTSKENKDILSIVADFRPHILFVSFGSPFSEMWIYKHRKELNKTVCASVGGAFDYLAHITLRPPKIIRDLGLEYVYRLLVQPWRFKRQLKLITFARLSIIEAIKYRLGV